MPYVHPHWRQRVKERISDSADAEYLFSRLSQSVQDQDGWATRKLRRRHERNIYYFYHGGEKFFAVVDETGPYPVPITILPPETEVLKKRSKRRKPLAAGCRKWTTPGNKSKRRRETRREC